MVRHGLSVRSPTDRRQPLRSDQRRTAILTALDEHLRITGFEALSIADVARQAGVTRSAFYFYFENKAAAVAALLGPMYDDVFAANDLLTGPGDPRHRIRAMIEALLDTGERHRYLLQAMLEARAVSTTVRELWDTARESFVPAVAAMIEDERVEGRAPAGCDPVVLASALLEFNDRLLERFTAGTALSRQRLRDGAEAVWLGSIYPGPLVGSGSPPSSRFEQMRAPS
ncbi:TetR family transcriptional regulator [Mycolicibacterium thermoresistibile]